MTTSLPNLFAALPPEGARLTDCGRLALIGHHLDTVAATPGMGVRTRRDMLLEKLNGLLGPTQFEHIDAHCAAVARLSHRLARAMGMTHGLADRVRLVGLLHDIGKCVVPESVLAHPGPLGTDQWTVMNCHSEAGARIAALLGADDETVEAVRHHHTWFDATPPNEIPQAARIVCAADALATMTSQRSYHYARSPAEALAELRRYRGSQFDPVVVEAAPTAMGSADQAAA